MWIIIVFLIIGFFLFFIIHNESRVQGFREREAKKLLELQSELQSKFSKISIGQDYLTIHNELKSCGAISNVNLISEVMLDNGVIRKVYIWYLDWHYVDSTTTRIGTMPFHSSIINQGGNGISFNTGVVNNYSTDKTSKKAYIQMVFDNDKLVAKEQRGLF